MPPSEAPEALAVAARAFGYESGPFGPAAQREVAVEAPIEIRFGGAPFAVMMATPSHLEDFAFGFALTEGVVKARDEIRGVEVLVEGDGARVDVTLTGERMSAHLARKRAMTGRTGCGVCGIEDIEHLPAPTRRVPASAPIAPRAIQVALRMLDAAQPLNARTRAVHAAAWCGRDGTILVSREDVGRHNALDKLIGALMRAAVDPTDGFILITSRCSFEMVAKAAAFGAGTLVAVSAPTSLALSRAGQYGVSLIAVARSDQALVFPADKTDLTQGAAA